MKRTLLALTAFGLFAVGCGDDPTTPLADGLDVTLQAGRAGPVVHRVSVGGADICEAFGLPTGCDANFSLAAKEKADGSVSGQWTDVFKVPGPNGVIIHVTVDCLNVVGNEAWVSGVVTGPNFAGLPVITRVADNGTSAKDPLDQISFISEDIFGGCQVAPDLPLFDLTHGQVKVR